MIVSGKVTTGVLRGKPLIEKIYFRLVGIVGFTPFKGTMDLQLEKEINIEAYATKAVEHKFIDGTLHRDCWLAPIILHIRKERTDESGSTPSASKHTGVQYEQYECWAMQQVDGIYPKNIIEIIAKDKLRDKFNLEDGDVVKIEFTSDKEKGGPRGTQHTRSKTPLSVFKKKKGSYSKSQK